MLRGMNMSQHRGRPCFQSTEMLSGKSVTVLMPNPIAWSYHPRANHVINASSLHGERASVRGRVPIFPVFSVFLAVGPQVDPQNVQLASKGSQIIWVEVRQIRCSPASGV